MIRFFRTLALLSCLLLPAAARALWAPVELAPEISVVRAEFGMFAAADSKGPAFTPTTTIPWKENQSFGWIVVLKTTKPRIRWREEFTLPSAPRTWGDAEPQGVRTLSADYRTAITERESTPDHGIIYNSWSIAPGDPTGRHEIRLIIEGQKEIRFEFEIR